MKLTLKESIMVRAFVEESMGCTGAETAFQVIGDNMTWMNSDDLTDVLQWKPAVVAGVMSSLENKGCIVNSGESPRGAKVNDWYASDKAIKWYFKHMNSLNNWDNQGNWIGPVSNI